jgi:DNA-binding HxlR family transcriptional regulator
MAEERVYSCPVEVTVDLIGGRWKPLILWHLRERGVLRHGELRRLIPGVTQKMLTQQLRRLEEDGLVERREYPEVPPRVEYRLTEQGSGLHELLDRFCAWGLAQAERQGLTLTKPDAGPDRAPRPGPVGSSRGGAVGSVPGRRGDRAPGQCT